MVRAQLVPQLMADKGAEWVILCLNTFTAEVLRTRYLVELGEQGNILNLHP